MYLNMPGNMPDSAWLWDSVPSGTLFLHQSESEAVCLKCCSLDGRRRCHSRCILPCLRFRPCSGTRIRRPEPVSEAVRHICGDSSQQMNCIFLLPCKTNELWIFLQNEAGHLLKYELIYEYLPENIVISFDFDSARIRGSNHGCSEKTGRS